MATAVALYALGTARVHQHHFVLFLLALLGLGLVVVVTFAATAAEDRGGRSRPADGSGPVAPG